MKNSIYQKIRAQVIIMVIVAAAMGAVAILTIFIMRGNVIATGRQLGAAAAEDGRASLEAQIKEALLQLAQNRAVIADDMLAAVARLVNGVALKATYIASNPDSYLPREVEFPQAANAGLTVAQLALAEGVDHASVKPEIGLLGNISEMLNIKYDAYDYVGSVYIGTESGFTIFSDADSDVNDSVYDARTRGWYQAAKQAGGQIWSDVFSDASGRGLAITCAEPFYGADGKMLGVAGAGMDLKTVKELVVKTRLGETGYAFISNERGEIIISDTVYESPEGTIVRPNLSDLMPPQTTERLLKGGSGVGHAVIGGADYFVAYAPLKTLPWSMAIIISDGEVFAPAAQSENRIISLTAAAVNYIDRMMLFTFGLFAVMLLLYIAAGLALGRRAASLLAKPIIELERGAGIISGGNLDHRLEVRTGDEMEKLADAFNSMIASIKEITLAKERVEKAGEEKAREAEIIHDANLNLQTALDMLPVGVRIMSLKDQALLYANKASLEIFGCAPFEDNMAGRSWFEFMPEIQPDGRRTADVAGEFFQKDSAAVEMQCLKPGGEPFFARISSATINYKGVRSSLGVIEDMTAEEEYRQRLKNAARKEQEANQLKSRFLATMSHEIRTPMNAILGIAEIQLQDKSHPPGTAEALGIIYESGALLLNIINDILDFSKIEADKLELVPVKYDIPSLINDTVQLNRLRYESKPIEFELRVDENTPHDLYGDELRIKQVLNNILSNAFKYTEEGRIVFSVAAESEPGGNARSDEVTLVFRVSDTGRGLTEEQIDKLYDDFTRFDIAADRAIVGTGLGMSITKRLVDLMGGEISVESQPGQGSVFTVRLPQKRAGSAVCGTDLAGKLRKFRFQSEALTKKSLFLREYMPYGSVLVVDDVESNIYVTKGLLLPYGLKIETASSGFEAIEKVKNGGVYDVIFMDHMMPKMDGIEAVKIIRGLGYSQTIVALTANALVGQAEVFRQNGFDGFIPKPIDSRELNLLLNEFIRNRKPPEIVEAAQREQRERGVNDTAEPAPKTSEVKKFFLRDAENALRVLEGININNPGETDTASYVVTVHGLKSALANIGETGLSAFADRLEQAGRDHNPAVITNETSAFIEALKSLIEKCRPAEESIGAEIEDPAFLREKLSEIIKTCGIFNANAAKAALKDLQQKAWPGRVNDVLDEIDVHLLHSAFKKAAASAEDLMSSLKNGPTR